MLGFSFRDEGYFATLPACVGALLSEGKEWDSTFLEPIMPIIDHKIPTADASRSRAVEYVRMSTEHQQYSTDNQRAKIREYADARHIDIVRTYQDDGKSGLTLRGRHALRQLVKDVESKKNNFQSILVYDVSRWGRFQDADESAHYEYLCKHAGVKVIYCAEQFDNDGSPVATIVKGVKRAMAGEYSRELSVKVFTGQCRFARLGFRQGGGSRVFGYRSILTDTDGNIKGELARGERKCVQTYHVVLALGNDEEAAIVRQIFKWFVKSQLNESEIARKLNAENILKSGKPWRRSMVHDLLTNEAYIGCNVFNKYSGKLGGVKHKNPPAEWVRKDNAHPALISLATFKAAQRIIVARPPASYTREQCLNCLRATLEKHKRLSTKIIDSEPGSPSSAVYADKFGTLVEAYRQVGFFPLRECLFTKVNRIIERRFPDLAALFANEFEGRMQSPDGIEQYSLALARAYAAKVEALLSASDKSAIRAKKRGRPRVVSP